MNVYLIGMPGSGKSAVGRELAVRLALPFVDLDEVAEAIAGKSIASIFEDDGEARFRAAESAALTRVSAGAPAVVACGGGTPLDAMNRVGLGSSGTVVFLSATLETLCARVRTDGSRPLIADKGDLERLLAERDVVYRSAADHVVDSTGTPEETAERVAALVAEQVAEANR